MIKEQNSLFVADRSISLVEAMQKIDANSRGILFITNQDGSLCGVVSDGDIRRWILRTGKLEAQITELMNRTPLFLDENSVAAAPGVMSEKQIAAVPIVDISMNIVSIVFADDVNKPVSVKDSNKEGLKGVSVIVMAGGKGTRLYPYTKILPKPLIPIGDMPIVERIINSFKAYGIKDFFLTVNYRKKMIQSYFSEIDCNYDITYVEEDKPLGTAGSIRLVQKSFNEPVFVTNCDILVRADYEDIYKYHLESGNAITMVTAMKNDVIPYGVVYSKENGEIERIEEKPQRSYLINTGMYVIDPQMIELIPQDTFFHMTHLTEKALQDGYKVGCYPVSEDSFLDMGELAEMKRMEEKLNIGDR